VNCLRSSRHRAGSQHLARDETGPARRDNHDIGLAQVRGKVRRAGVADGHRGVLAQEQERRGLAHDVGAPDDDSPGALQLHVGPLEELHGRVGRGRQEAVVAQRQQAGVQRVDPVDVLGRVEGVDHDPQRDAGRQRLLDDDPGDRALGTEGEDLPAQ